MLDDPFHSAHDSRVEKGYVEMISNILEDRRDFDDARFSSEGTSQGYIDPNQFDQDEILGEPGIDQWTVYADALAAAKQIANHYGVAVKVKARQYDSEADLDWGHSTIAVYPAGWPKGLTPESVAAWIWAHGCMSADWNAILRAERLRRAEGFK